VFLPFKPANVTGGGRPRVRARAVDTAQRHERNVFEGGVNLFNDFRYKHASPS
jgi:hypothetical protein